MSILRKIRQVINPKVVYLVVYMSLLLVIIIDNINTTGANNLIVLLKGSDN